jgi:ribosomal protein S18 acetylase RimI-like enzyme
MIEYCKHHQIEEIYLSVDKDNEKAIKLYKRHNFKDVSEDKCGSTLFQRKFLLKNY